MYVILGICFILLGIFMIMKPETIHNLKYHNFFSEPPKIFLISARFSGCIFIGLGLVLVSLVGMGKL